MLLPELKSVVVCETIRTVSVAIPTLLCPTGGPAVTGATEGSVSLPQKTFCSMQFRFLDDLFYWQFVRTMSLRRSSNRLHGD
jgi:hypothetical protein